jgi:hypothetical protein
MHFRRLAALVLGAWLGGSLLITTFTAQNKRFVDQILSTPALEAVDFMVKIQEADVRILLGYQASEGNRWLVRTWEVAQLALGAVLLVSLFLSVNGNKYPIVLCLLMIGTVVFLHWFLTPQMERLSRAVDFVKPGQISVARDRLRSLETGYSIAETLKLMLGLGAVWGLLLRARRRRGHREAELD